MCDAMHFAEELSGRFRDDRPALAAVSISDPSHISCVGNDYGFAYIFSRYLEGLGNEGDVLLAISTSGNSENVIKAIEVAKRKGIKVIGLTGKDVRCRDQSATFKVCRSGSRDPHQSDPFHDPNHRADPGLIYRICPPGLLKFS